MIYNSHYLDCERAKYWFSPRPINEDVIKKWARLANFWPLASPRERRESDFTKRDQNLLSAFPTYNPLLFSSLSLCGAREWCPRDIIRFYTFTGAEPRFEELLLKVESSNGDGGEIERALPISRALWFYAHKKFRPSDNKTPRAARSGILKMFTESPTSGLWLRLLTRLASHWNFIAMQKSIFAPIPKNILLREIIS